MQTYLVLCTPQAKRNEDIHVYCAVFLFTLQGSILIQSFDMKIIIEE